MVVQIILNVSLLQLNILERKNSPKQKQHKEDNLVFQNIIKRSNKVSTWSKNGITEHKGYDKKVLSMYENVFFEMLERIIQLENEKEQNHKSQVINHKSLVICDC